MNIFIRSRERFKTQAGAAKAVACQARFVASDETGVRIEAVNTYPWVFHCKNAIFHYPEFSCGERVMVDRMDEHQPEAWASDCYSAQQIHGRRRRTCLAHSARENAFALAAESTDIAASTLMRKKRVLENQPTKLLSAMKPCDLACKLQAKIARARDPLLTFCDYPGEVDVTHDGSERKTAAVHDSPQDNQRLSRIMGHVSRSRRAHHRRRCKVQGRSTLPDHLGNPQSSLNTQEVGN